MKLTVILALCLLLAKSDARPEWEFVGVPDDVDDDYDSFLSPHESKSEQKSSLKSKQGNKSIPFPSRRVGPGSWQDPYGNWWLFGGQGPSSSSPSFSPSQSEDSTNSKSVYFLSDLWVYTQDEKLLHSRSPTLSSSWSSKGWNSEWKLVFRPDITSKESPYTSFPENLGFPLLCGSETGKHLALYSWHKNSPRAHASYNDVDSTAADNDGESHNSPFSEDNVVWLYDIPQEFITAKKQNFSNVGVGEDSGSFNKRKEKQGLWTSYVCCDACLPDGEANTTFEFCPEFSRDPISWCGEDSLMMLQLVLKEAGPESPEKSKKAQAQSSIYSTSTTTFTSGPFDNSNNNDKNNSTFEKGLASGNTGESSSNRDMTATTTQKVVFGKKDEIIPRRRRSLGKPTSTTSAPGTSTERLEKRTEVTGAAGAESEKMKRNGGVGEDSEMKKKSSGAFLNWWKFDLVSTEWIKMPEVNIPEGELTDQVRNGDCRAVPTRSIKTMTNTVNGTSSSTTSYSQPSSMVYILCPTKGNLLNRVVLLFHPEKALVQLLGTIHLNNAFTDKKVWLRGRSVLNAMLCDDNQTSLIFLAYHKLLDVWVHDHSSNRLYPVENVWRGESLHKFQRTQGFYKLSISLPVPNPSMSKKSFMKSPKIDGPDERESEYGSTYSFFMVNPRSKLANFEDFHSAAHFHIRIVPDREVFLPPRDAGGDFSSEVFVQADHSASDGKDLSSTGLNNDSVSLKMQEKVMNPGPPLSLRRNLRGDGENEDESSLSSKVSYLDRMSNEATPSPLPLPSEPPPPPPPTSPHLPLSKVSQVDQIKMAKVMAEHRKNKYKMDTLSPKKRILAKLANVSPSASKKRILGLTKAKFSSSSSLPTSADKPTHSSEAITTEKIEQIAIDNGTKSKSQIQVVKVGNLTKVRTSDQSEILDVKPTTAATETTATTFMTRGESNPKNGQDTNTTFTTAIKADTVVASVFHKTLTGNKNSNISFNGQKGKTVAKISSNSVNNSVESAKGQQQELSTQIELENEKGRNNTNAPISTLPEINAEKKGNLNRNSTGIMMKRMMKGETGNGSTTYIAAAGSGLARAVPRIEMAKAAPLNSSTPLLNSHQHHGSIDVGSSGEEQQQRTNSNEGSLDSNRQAVQKISKRKNDQLYPSPTTTNPTPAKSTTFSSWNLPSNGNLSTSTILSENTGRAAATTSVATTTPTLTPVRYQNDETGESMKSLTNIIRIQGDQALHTHQRQYSDGFLVSPVEADRARAKSSSSTGSVASIANPSPPSSPENSHEDTDNIKLNPIVDNLNSKDTSPPHPNPSHPDTEEGVRNSNINKANNGNNINNGELENDNPSVLTMTYGSSEMVVEPNNDSIMIPYDGQEGVSYVGETSYGPTIFFAVTLSFFASIGVVLFIRRCVKCPPRRESVLIKEPPPIRYSVIPDDLAFHTPIV